MTREEITEYFTDNAEKLAKFALKFTKDVEDAKDLLHDVYYTAVQKRTYFADGSNFGAWVYTIMRNKFTNDYYRQRSRIADDREDAITNEIDECTPEDLAQLRSLKAMFDALPEYYRIPMKMYVAGFKYREIADKLHVPLGTAKTRIFIARRRLSVYLEDTGERRGVQKQYRRFIQATI